MGGCGSQIEAKEPKKNMQRKQTKSLNKVRVSPDIFVSLKQGSLNHFYNLGEIIGEGGFGSVRKGMHRSTQIVRAIKQIRKDQIPTEDEQLMFFEVDILKQLDHPNILKIYELYQDNKNYYLITEFLEGGELFDRLKKQKIFTESMAANYMKQILSAVSYCHSRSIVHRDLKLENLLFETKKPDSNLKIIDFGTSKQFNRNTKLTKRLGTIYYMAPEVFQKSYDERCDVWSCGVILYILLCGYPPFNGRDADIKKKIEEGKFTFRQDEWGKISDEAKNLIKRMLTYDPQQRITAQEALNDTWIQSKASNTPINTNLLNNLSNFYVRGKSDSKWRSAVQVYIVTQVSTNKEKEEILKNFKAMDKNNDGTLSKEELLEAYEKIYDKTKAEQIIDDILNRVDINNSGQIDFTEFLIASMHNEKLAHKSKLEKVFKMFDIVRFVIQLSIQQDSNGQISKEEMQQIMGGIDIDEEEWKNILEESDKDHDGQISLNEFIDLMQNLHV